MNLTPKTNTGPTPDEKYKCDDCGICEACLLRQKNAHDVKSLIKVLRISTQPVEGHNDPGSIDDCWNELEELVYRCPKCKFPLCVSRGKLVCKECI